MIIAPTQPTRWRKTSVSDSYSVTTGKADPLILRSVVLTHSSRRGRWRREVVSGEEEHLQQHVSRGVTDQEGGPGLAVAPKAATCRLGSWSLRRAVAGQDSRYTWTSGRRCASLQVIPKLHPLQQHCLCLGLLLAASRGL